MTMPLPPITEDPAFLAAKAVHAEHAERVDAINGDRRLSVAGRAERIAEVTTEANAAIQRHADDLNDLRQARIADLQSRFPIGPGIPDSASAADAAVLATAFRGAYAEARAATPDALVGKLADAQRFGDVLAERAVLTAAFDERHRHAKTIAAYAAQHPDVAEALTELPTLSVSGDDLTTRLHERQVFRPVGTNSMTAPISSSR
jgi:hypothetical protein